MKTIQINFKNLLLILLIGAAFTSCSSEDDSAPEPQGNTITLPCNAFQSNNPDAILLLKNVNNGVDYIIDCEAVVEVDLKIEPGVVIEFKDAAGMVVKEAGSLSAIGTQNEPIIFTSAVETKGAWKGIMSESQSVKNRFDYVTMEYAGTAKLSYHSESASLILHSDAYFRLNDVTIKNGLNNGFLNDGYNLDIEMNNCTITNCDIPIYAEANLASNIFGGSFTGNTTDVIRLFGQDAGEIKTSQTWTDLGVPYRFLSDLVITKGAKLTIEPGVVIEFEDTKGISIDKMFDEGSAIIAVGTSTKPIVFTGVTKAPGAWRSIFCYRSTSIQNKMDNVLIEYAGGAGADGAIEFWTNPVLSVTNSTFKDISACAVYNHLSNEDNPNFTESNNTVVNVSGGYMCHD